MKGDTLELLKLFKADLQLLKKELNKQDHAQVSRIGTRNLAIKIADFWVESLRSPLEHRFKFDPKLIGSTSEQMQKLHKLARPNNQKSSYLSCITMVLNKFDDKFILPIQQSPSNPSSVVDLSKLIPAIKDAEQSDYLKEAINCAQHGFFRPAIVTGWCAAIDHIQRKIEKEGFGKFNAGSTRAKNQTSGKFKRYTKEFNVQSVAELQTVFDTDLILVCESMGWLDSNESSRLETCFGYRNNSAHPGKAPILEAHLVVFFTDVTHIVLTNPNWSL